MTPPGTIRVNKGITTALCNLGGIVDNVNYITISKERGIHKILVHITSETIFWSDIGEATLLVP